jgi:hypothetical protein
MDQFILTQETVRQMLEEAFKAGFESPMEFLTQETSRIYNKHVKKAKLTSAGPKPQKVKAAPLSDDEIANLPNMYAHDLYEPVYYSMLSTTY